MLFYLFLFLSEFFDFRSVFELFRDEILVAALLTLFELLSCKLLHFLDLYSVKVKSIFFLLFDRILHAQVAKEFEVDESKQGTVKLKESSHNFIVHIKRQLLIELIWTDPSNRLSHYLYLVVNSLYREKCFLKTLCYCVVQQELL